MGLQPSTGSRKYIRKSGFRTRKEAERYESLALARYHEDENLPTRAKQVRFKEVAELWLMQYEKTVKEATYLSTADQIRLYIMPQLKNHYVDKITLKQCQTLVNHWYDSYTKANTILSVARRVFDLAVRAGYCKQNPMKMIMIPKKYPSEELQALPFTARRN